MTSINPDHALAGSYWETDPYMRKMAVKIVEAVARRDPEFAALVERERKIHEAKLAAKRAEEASREEESGAA